MDIELDTRSPTPHYEQIRSQIAQVILIGSMTTGSNLPPIRQLAGHLGVSNGAVARAYQALEREGLVVTAGKKGTSVADPSGRRHVVPGAVDRAAALNRAALAYAAVAHSLGYDAKEAADQLLATMPDGASTRTQAAASAASAAEHA